MSTASLMAVWGGSWFVCFYYGYVLHEALPRYIAVANGSPLSRWGAEGWILTGILALLSVCVAYHSMQTKACHDALRARFFS